MVIKCWWCQRERYGGTGREDPAPGVTYQVCEPHAERIYVAIRATIARHEAEAAAEARVRRDQR